jgi:hypothetical protein
MSAACPASGLEPPVYSARTRVTADGTGHRTCLTGHKPSGGTQTDTRGHTLGGGEVAAAAAAAAAGGSDVTQMTS